MKPTYSTCYMSHIDSLPSSHDHYSRSLEFAEKAKSPKVTINTLNDLPANIKPFHQPITQKEGFLSKKAQSNIRNSCNWLLLFSCKKTVYSRKDKSSFTFFCNLITLTLSAPQLHSDREIITLMLHPFLKWLFRKGATMYVWKAEVQPGTNNIHFHIDINHFIHWYDIKIKWNQLQWKRGYGNDKKYSEFIENTNSTDVSAIKNANNLANEMAKYIAKMTHPFIVKEADQCDIIERSTNPKHRYFQENTDFKLVKKTLFHYLRPLHCRIWACSESLSNIKIYYNKLDPGFDELITGMVNHSEVKQLDFARLFIHPNLKYCHTYGTLREKLIELYNNRKAVIPQQTIFTVESFK